MFNVGSFVTTIYDTFGIMFYKMNIFEKKLG